MSGVFEPGKEGCKDWQDHVHPCILPFLVQDKLSCSSLHPSFPGSRQSILFILASFLSWFKTNYSVHPCILPFLVQDKLSCSSLHPSFPGSKQTILFILASFLSWFKKKHLLKTKITPLQNKKHLFITDIKKK